MQDLCVLFLGNKIIKMKNLILILTVFSFLGCRKDAEKILLKNENSWQFRGEINIYRNERFSETKFFAYEMIFKNETSGIYRVYNSNDPFKNFTCRFYSGFMIGKKVDINIEEFAPFGLGFRINKVKKNKINLSATSDNSFDFLSGPYTPTTKKITAEMIKL